MTEISFERGLVRSINFRFDKKYKSKDLMEWSTKKIEPHEGETLYEVDNCFIAMKDNIKDKLKQIKKQLGEK